MPRTGKSQEENLAKLREYLNSLEGYASIDSIAEELGISRSTLTSRMQQLGYDDYSKTVTFSNKPVYTGQNGPNLFCNNMVVDGVLKFIREEMPNEKFVKKDLLSKVAKCKYDIKCCTRDKIYGAVDTLQSLGRLDFEKKGHSFVYWLRDDEE